MAMTAFPRPENGSKEAQRARQNGLIPGIIYGPRTAERRVYVSEEMLRKEMHKRGDTFLSTMTELTIDGERLQVLPRDVAFHPFRPRVLACNWLVYVPGRHPGVRLDLPLKAVNEERCPGYKEGGWLLELMYKLPVYVHGPFVPPFLGMDLRGKRLGDKIMASEVSLGEGVTLRVKNMDQDFAVARLVGSRRGTDGEDGAAGADGAPAAAGGAAAPGGAKAAAPAGGAKAAAPAAGAKAAAPAAGAKAAAPAAGADKKK